MLERSETGSKETQRGRESGSMQLIIAMVTGTEPVTEIFHVSQVPRPTAEQSTCTDVNKIKPETKAYHDKHRL